MKIKTLERIPSCLTFTGVVVVIALPIFGGPLGWRERIEDPCVCLMALALVGVAMLLWPLGENGDVQHRVDI